MRTGEVETNLTKLLDPYGFSRALELVEMKRAGERVALPPGVLESFKGEVERAFVSLEEAENASPLPLEPPNRLELEEWLVALRRARL